MHRTSNVWIAGPPGAGKTTLVGSWIAESKLPCLWYRVDAGDKDVASFFHHLGLAVARVASHCRRPMPKFMREHQSGVVTAFARNFFNEMAQRIDAPFVLVLDNLQELGTETPLFALLRESLEELAGRAFAVLISRAQPAPPFARMEIEQRLHVIGWDSLRLSSDESVAMVEFLQCPERGPLAPDDVRALRDQCDGWLAGLLLLMSGRSRVRAYLGRSFDSNSAQQLFDYFAAELFDRTEDTVKEFLMQTAWCGSFTAEMAERLTGFRGTRKVLNDLVRYHHFTERHETSRIVHYQYHPLFREFLREQTRDVKSQSDLAKLLHRVAITLEWDGRDEDAIALHIENRDCASVVRAIRRLAPVLAEQGRFATIADAIGKLPGQIIAQDPWLLYWQAVSSPPQYWPAACRQFRKAYDLFMQHDDSTGAYLAWVGAVDSITNLMNDLREHDFWSQSFDELRKRHPNFPSQEVEEQVIIGRFRQLAVYMPQHPEFDHWYEQARRLALRQDAKPTARLPAASLLFAHDGWCGRYDRAREFMPILNVLSDSAGTSTLPRLRTKWAEARFAWLNGDHEGCLAHMRHGLEIAQTSGVHLWDGILILHGISSCLSVGDLAQAESLFSRADQELPRMKRGDQAAYWYLRGWHAALIEDVIRARTFLEQALPLATQVAFKLLETQAHLAMSLTMHDLRDHNGAQTHLEEARRRSREMRSPIYEYLCRLTDAQYAFDRQDERAGIAHLRTAMALGRQHNFMTFHWWRPKIMSRLCALALTHGIEVDYVRAMIRERRLVADPHLPMTVDWPFPVRIYALGHFRVLVNDVPLVFRTKTQKKPLELLKAVLSFGGESVREEKVAEALWPASEADDAAQALASALHRLRKLIGEEAIERQDGRLTLNPRYCWIDVGVMSQLVALIDNTSTDNRPEELGSLVERLFKIYRGAFLESESDFPGVLGMRERLRSKFLRSVETAVRYFAVTLRYDDVIDCCLRALDIDPLAEVFYRYLIRAYAFQDRKAEALATYERCCRVLAGELRIEPSRETCVLYEQLRVR